MDKNTAVAVLAIISLITAVTGTLIGNPNLNAQVTQAIQDYQNILSQLQTEVNSTFYSLQKQATYVISVLGTYYCMQNGTTGALDFRNTNPAVVINAAIGNTTAQGGGTVFVKAGNYSFPASNYLVNISNNVILSGEGWNTLFIMPPGTLPVLGGLIQNKDFGTTTADSNFEIDNIRFWGNHSAYSGGAWAACAIYVRGVQHVKFLHDYFQDQKGWAIILQSFHTDAPSFDIEVGNNYCDYAEYNFLGINVEAYAGWRVAEVNTHDNYVTNTDTGISYFGSVYDSSISRNTVISNNNTGSFSNGVGIALEDNSGYIPYDCSVIGNMVRNNTGGIGVDCQDCVIEGNTVLDNGKTTYGYGINVNGANSTGNVISSNMIRGAFNQYGMTVSSNNNSFLGNTFTAGMVQIALQVSASNCIISNNVFDKSGKYDGSATACDITGTNNIVTGNSFYDNVTSVFYRGLELDTQSNNTIVENNLFVNNHGIAMTVISGHNNVIEYNTFISCNTVISEGGTSDLVAYNIGYKTEGSASANNATATSFTFTPNNATGPVLRVYASFSTVEITAYSWSFTGANTLTITVANSATTVQVRTCYVEWFCWDYP